MNPVFARRRAERFSSLLEGSSTRAAGEAQDLETARMLELVAALRSAPAPEARPAFVSDLRSRLLLAAETELVAAEPTPVPAATARTTTSTRTRRRERRVAALVGGFALVSASTSMSVAAQSALPGDTLYPLKRALEQVHVTAVRDPEGKGATLLDNAAGRLDEVDELSRSGEQDPAVIAETLADFTAQAEEASDLLISDFAVTGRESSLQELRSFTAQSLESLQALEGLVPVDVRGSLVEATQVIDRITQRAYDACPSCSTLPLLDELVETAALGPLLDEVEADAPRAATPTQRPGGSAPAKGRSGATAGSDPAPAPTAPSKTPETPQTPTLPTPPRAPEAPRPSTKDPLGDIVTGVKNPLGGLLDDTLGTVDKLLGGSGQP
ncbi:DUF5667 domain-containing protein [Nocardioides litoris]|uniref:DUF5667 domain-containing protein n=1 Tax=Nocardioides litoris TaxID=1926648 RepID=UPI001122B6EB|nr:DUF5667 domain-containing protein [Nocardioides litoris]